MQPIRFLAKESTCNFRMDVKRILIKPEITSDVNENKSDVM
jgi:hypothetical protein